MTRPPPIVIATATVSARPVTTVGSVLERIHLRPAAGVGDGLCDGTRRRRRCTLRRRKAVRRDRGEGAGHEREKQQEQKGHLDGDGSRRSCMRRFLHIWMWANRAMSLARIRRAAAARQYEGPDGPARRRCVSGSRRTSGLPRDEPRGGQRPLRRHGVLPGHAGRLPRAGGAGDRRRVPARRALLPIDAVRDADEAATDWFARNRSGSLDDASYVASAIGDIPAIPGSRHSHGDRGGDLP